ncbi:RNA polymerase sigma24 factor [Paenibacillus swuensis]|uniref:RNA polymerase sigma24 factor n=2 Tax=Paenibacillus swuensis TaxID=1178515 RepID=A0A172TPK3_9BACL|nr:RNA polymerase sigma24 factor [Paenibacillus swuensis]
MFHVHYPTVVRKLTGLVRNESIAEDLAQEVFLRLYQHPPNEIDAVGAWLHRVLTRVGYDYLNRQTRERQIIEKQEHVERSSEQLQQSNEDVVMSKMNQNEVQEVLDALPERDRQLLMLKYSGYSYNEIAEKLQVQKSFVGTLLQRASVKFKKQAEAGMLNPYKQEV